MYTGIWGKKIPTFIALFVLFISIWTTSYLVQTKVINIGNAQQPATPQNIKVTNSTDTSFTITFTTYTKSSASIDYGTTPVLGTVVFDDRDKKTTTKHGYFSHTVTIGNLKPSTKYYFSLLVGGNRFLDLANNNQPFSTSTGPEINLSSSQKTAIQGHIVGQNGLAAEDTLVYVEFGNSQVISTFTDSNGAFTVPLDSLRDSSLTQYIIPENTSLVTLTFQKGNIASEIQATLENAKNLPLITLSNNYNFASVSNLSENTASVSPQLVVPIPSVTPGKVTLLYPKPKTSLVDQQPLFEGTAAPGKTVSISFEPQQNISIQATVDSSGFWSFRPSDLLTPGNHTITIQAPDASGIIRRIVEAFTIFPSGVQVAQAATPSASATPTAIPTSTPFPVATSTPTPSPRSSLTPTGTGISTPTPTKSIGITPTGATGSTTPTLTPTLTASEKLTTTPGSTTPTSSVTSTPTPGLLAIALTTTPTVTGSQQTLSGTPTQPTITGTITPAATGDETTSIVLSGVALFFITAGSLLLFIL